ncbi:MAG: hypothetical protein AB7G11_11265 [Phycisphaerales bacterium]
MSYLQALTLTQWIQAALGVLLVVVGGIVLWKTRPRRHAEAGGMQRSIRLPLLGEVSEASRLLVAVALLIVGYHVAVWVFPSHVTPVQVPRERWWVLVGICLVTVVSSVRMDRHELDGGDSEGEPEDRD